MISMEVTSLAAEECIAHASAHARTSRPSYHRL